MLLITGCAGFIGFHLAKKRLKMGDKVVGVDNLNDYYDVTLKEARLAKLKQYDNFSFEKLDISDRELVPELFEKYQFTKVVNLAAQAGVRYSLENPLAYIDSNVLGFTNIIEGCRHHNIEHLVYASTSSVYGANESQPFSESKAVDHPLAIYAASKKCNELIAHAYAHLYGLPSTGLRFFTVYGPWGRPDMALFLFTKAMMKDEPINVFNHGNMIRDFTYVDDIVEGISRAVDKPAEPNKEWDAQNPDPASSYAPYRIYNIGNSNPVPLMDYIHAVEKALGKKAELNMMPMQEGDVPSTFADTSKLENDLGYKPQTSVDEGVAKFVKWYREFYE
jgi:UDP-glucuronate 4-epimerase